MYKKYIVYIGFGAILTSCIQWESWNEFPKDKGRLLYNESLVQ